MGSIRQNKIEGVIKEELSIFFQQNAREICLGSMVTVTTVRVTPDLSLARVYLSVFAGPPKGEVIAHIQEKSSTIRGEVGRKMKSLKYMPNFKFFVDDSLDYAQEIDDLLKK